MSKTAKQLSIDTDKLLVKSEQSVPDQQSINRDAGIRSTQTPWHSPGFHGLPVLGGP